MPTCNSHATHMQHTCNTHATHTQHLRFCLVVGKSLHRSVLQLSKDLSTWNNVLKALARFHLRTDKNALCCMCVACALHVFWMRVACVLHVGISWAWPSLADPSPAPLPRTSPLVAALRALSRTPGNKFTHRCYNLQHIRLL